MPVVTFSTRTVEVGWFGAPAASKKKSSKKTVSNSKATKTIKRQPNKLWLIAAGSFLLAFIILGLVWRTFTGPNYGQVAKFSQEATSKTALPNYTTLSTNYYSLNYPENYSQAGADISPAGVLDQKTLVSPDGQTKAVISINAAPYGGITLDSGYQNLVKQSDRYKFTNQYYHGEAIVIASGTKPPSESAALWLHNGFILTIKLSSATASQATLEQQLKDMLASVQFQD